jgi:GNAT superfamily N-acetyltransferase
MFRPNPQDRVIMVEWEVRPYQNGDEFGIVELQNIEPRTSPYTLERWLWRYKNNPYGFLTVVAEHKGEIVGQMGWWLLEMKIGGETCRASQASELVVHPNHRRQGMFLAIGKALARIAEEQKVHLTYGFPNAPAYGGHLQYGWIDVAQIPILTAYFDTYPMIKRPLSLVANLFYKKLKKKGASENIIRIDRFPEQIGTLAEKALLSHNIFVARSAKYLNWRFFKNPEQEYDIFADENGYVIMVTKLVGKRRIGFIIDIIAIDEKAFMALINKAIEELANQHVDSIKCMIQSPTYQHLLRKIGFTLFPKRKQTLIARINSANFQQIYDKNKQHWFITYGDCDFK